MSDEELDDLELDDDDGEMHWEREAREAIEGALADAKLDEIRGVIYASTGEDQGATYVTRSLILRMNS